MMIRDPCTVPLVKLSRSILERQFYIGKKRYRKKNCKKQVLAHNLFRLQVFRSWVVAEKCSDWTSCRDSFQQLWRPYSPLCTDALPRRIAYQLTELLSDAAYVFYRNGNKNKTIYNEYLVYPKVQYDPCTVPLVTLSRSILERQFYIEKKRYRKKNCKKTGFRT